MLSATTAAVYAESSAVIAWLLQEERGAWARSILDRSEAVVVSRLTLLECGRNVRRAEREGRITRAYAVIARRELEKAESEWIVMDLVGDVFVRAAEEFPNEPVRTLDALHLASAQIFDRNLGKVAMLTLDDRIRANAVALGLSLAT